MSIPQIVLDQREAARQKNIALIEKWKQRSFMQQRAPVNPNEVKRNCYGEAIQKKE